MVVYLRSGEFVGRFWSGEVVVRLRSGEVVVRF